MDNDSLKAMFDKAKGAMERAYQPYSKFRVGACILADDGNMYAGCNVENASYSLTLCAESSAISQMIASGAKQIKEILIVSDGKLIVMPCGACRQRLYEFAHENAKVHVFTLEGEHKIMTVGDLLPEPFGPEHLEG